jgi:hypothetical protein
MFLRSKNITPYLFLFWITVLKSHTNFNIILYNNDRNIK